MKCPYACSPLAKTHRSIQHYDSGETHLCFIGTELSAAVTLSFPRPVALRKQRAEVVTLLAAAELVKEFATVLDLHEHIGSARVGSSAQCEAAAE
jgi:hypothetical protein